MTNLQRLDDCLARIHDSQGEGKRTYIRLFEDQARACASAWDAMHDAGMPLPPLAGMPVSVKDLFDVAGTTTTAGSVALKDAAPAQQDAPVLKRLRAAGAVIVGTTNMTEFAMGGLGLNPHYGTPRNPYDRKTGRIPGGSSSGAAVSVTDGMATAAIGSDTAGSVRMPAAVCGLTGFKPTARRVPIDGSIPLAASLDSVGPLAADVATCALIDAVLAGEQPDVPVPMPLAGLRFAVAKTVVFDDVEPVVADAFARALTKLSKAGARIVEIPFAELNEVEQASARGSFSVIEGYAYHRELLEKKRDLYDPIIAARFANGQKIGAADYIALRNARADLIERTRRVTAGFDAILMPTVPIVAPKIADLESDENRYLAANRLMIRNPGLVNFLDRCALTIPAHERGSAPVGLTLMGETLGDRRILSIGLSVEAALSA
jgi:aspartyl-tRNA(Asn)/glutamyl-tRNA(Gln) amidotransferase subunit A